MNLNYEVKGKGKNIILLHGWSKQSSLKSMQKLQEEFVKLGYKVWSIDLPGFGESPEAPKSWGVADYARAIDEFIKKKIGDSYYLLGHSFGGSLTGYISAHLASKPERIILVSSSGLRYKTLKAKILLPFSKIFKVFLSILPYPLRKKLRKIVYYYIIKERDYVDSEEKKEQYLRVTNEDQTETFKSVKTPTLIIWGKDDKITPLEMGKKLNSLINNSRLEIIKGRHGIPFTQASEIARLSDKFINAQ